MPGIRGVHASIEWAYYTAATLQAYSVYCDQADRVWKMRATVVACDRYQLTQRPLRFVAPHEKGTWTWPIESFELVNGSITAVLGSPWTSKKGV